MRKRTTLKHLPAVGCLLFVAAVSLGGAEPVCVSDLRTVTVSMTEPCYTLRVLTLRCFRGGEEETAPSPVRVRPDALGIRACAKKFVAMRAGGNEADCDGIPDTLPGDTEMRELRVEDGVCRLPSIARGDSLLFRLQYDLPCDFAPRSWWASFCPSEMAALEKCEFRLVLPRGEAIASCRVGKWGYRKESTRNEDVHVYRLAECPGSVHSNAQQTSEAFVVVGCVTTWQRVGEGLVKLLPGDGGAADLSDSAVVDSLAGGSVEDCFDRVAGFNRLRSSFGFAAKGVEDVVGSGAGNCKDLAIVLARQLANRGVLCSMVYRASGMSSLDGTIPCPYVFDHVSVAVPLEKGTWLLDPYERRRRFDPYMVLGNEVKVSGNLLFIPWPARGKNERKADAAGNRGKGDVP